MFTLLILLLSSKGTTTFCSILLAPICPMVLCALLAAASALLALLAASFRPPHAQPPKPICGHWVSVQIVLRLSTAEPLEGVVIPSCQPCPLDAPRSKVGRPYIVMRFCLLRMIQC